MLDAEPLLLIDDQKSQILEFHILRQQPVGADDQVDIACFQPLHNLFLLGF